MQKPTVSGSVPEELGASTGAELPQNSDVTGPLAWPTMCLCSANLVKGGPGLLCCCEVTGEKSQGSLRDQGLYQEGQGWPQGSTSNQTAPDMPGGASALVCIALGEGVNSVPRDRANVSCTNTWQQHWSSLSMFRCMVWAGG